MFKIVDHLLTCLVIDINEIITDRLYVFDLFQITFLIYLLYLKLGWSAIIGSACCIAIMIPLQFIIGKKMSSNSKEISVTYITYYILLLFVLALLISYYHRLIIILRMVPLELVRQTSSTD